ncbi:UNVERIFIED_CONTAM: hypothetical protein HDU68_008901 [Siphonaria sp. JEL0065]|nr:hypothetical protein HDU68_008901 [Siphonaria sp. JEL0065]
MSITPETPPRTRLTAKELLGRASFQQSASSSLATLYEDQEASAGVFQKPNRPRVTAKELLGFTNPDAILDKETVSTEEREKISSSRGGGCPFSGGGGYQSQRKQRCPVTGATAPDNDDNNDSDGDIAVPYGCAFIAKRKLDPVAALLKAPNSTVALTKSPVIETVNSLTNHVKKESVSTTSPIVSSPSQTTSKNRLTARQLLGLDSPEITQSSSPKAYNWPSSELPPKPNLQTLKKQSNDPYDEMVASINGSLKTLEVLDDTEYDDLLEEYGVSTLLNTKVASETNKSSSIKSQLGIHQYNQQEPVVKAKLESSGRLTNSEIMSRLDSILSQWFREYNPNQFIKSYKAFGSSQYSSIILNNLLNDAMKKGGISVAHTARLLPHAVTEKCFTVVDVKSSLATIASTIWKLEPYMQSCYKYFGILYGAMMVYDEYAFSIKSLHEMLNPLLDYESQQDILRAPSALGHTLETVLLIKGEGGLKELYKRQNFELQYFWPSNKSRFEIEDWMDESGLECLIYY